ncbi:Fbxw4 [Columba guinea]|nr:Fbxw4 [Columba guinea]
MRDLEEFLCLLAGDTGHQDQTLLLCLDGITVNLCAFSSGSYPAVITSVLGASLENFSMKTKTFQKEDVDLIPNTGYYAEKHIHNIDNLSNLPFLVDSADQELLGAAGIPVKERVKVSQNWRHGRCRRETVLKWKCKQVAPFSSTLFCVSCCRALGLHLYTEMSLMPWMELDGEYLYLSQAENIQAYRLCPDGTGLQRHPQAIFSGHQEDVCRFVLVNSHIVSGGGDGSIVLHKIHGSYSVKFSAHEQEVNCVDFQGGLIVSGSRDRTAKVSSDIPAAAGAAAEVWSLSTGRVGQCLHTMQTEDRVWSIAISPLLSSFVTGTACCGHTSPLRIWDIESGQLLTCLGTDFHHGAGVLDVFYETPSLLLSCGYDTYIRYWDIRTSTRKCVQEWEEPHDSALYCIRSDKNHMIASGSSYYGVVRLWDKRQTRCLQPRARIELKGRASPAISVCLPKLAIRPCDTAVLKAVTGILDLCHFFKQEFKK